MFRKYDIKTCFASFFLAQLKYIHFDIACKNWKGSFKIVDLACIESFQNRKKISQIWNNEVEISLSAQIQLFKSNS